ncbi:MAG: alpha/beta hydrolase [Sphingomonadales bacterium]|nr:MAG: alpha/beta hydrolase [Sphingomonadales bacterium]
MTASAEHGSAFFPGFETRRLTVDGVDIHFVVGGSGPPLLLVHGAPQSGIMWRRIAPELAKRFTLIIPDLRGYGRSGKPARADYSKRRMAADLVAVMDSLGHDRFFVAGHDRGARVTRRLIKDHQPRIVRGAILDIVPTAYLYANISQQAAINLWNWCIWPAPEPIPETIIDPVAQVTMVVHALGGEPDPEAADDYIRTNGNAESLHAMCEDYRAGATVDLEHDAADAATLIDVPLLIAWGSKSVSTASIFDVRAGWMGEGSDMHFASIPSGHFMAEELPDETTALLLDFFG